MNVSVLEDDMFSRMLAHGMRLIEAVTEATLFSDDTLMEHFRRTLAGPARDRWEEYNGDNAVEEYCFQEHFKRFLRCAYTTDEKTYLWKTLRKLYCPEDLGIGELNVLLVEWKTKYDWFGHCNPSQYRIKLMLFESVDPV